MNIPEKRPHSNHDYFDRDDGYEAESSDYDDPTDPEQTGEGGFSQPIRPSEHLAERTCLKIWDEIDHADEAVTPPVSDSLMGEERRRLIPKFPRFERSSNKTTPFILKKVTAVEVPTEPRKASRAVPPAISTDSTLPLAGEQVDSVIPMVSSSEIPETVHARGTIPFSSEPVITPALTEISATPTIPAAAVAKKPSFTLDDLKKEFARERARNAKQRRRRFRSPLINGEIREELRDEYYWEILPPESPVERQTTRMKKEIRRRAKAEQKVFKLDDGETEDQRPASLLDAIFVEPVAFVGHATLASARRLRKVAQGEEETSSVPEEINHTLAKRPGKPGDMLISIVAGVLIAVVFVFPVIRMSTNGLYQSIRKSNVRKIGESVTVSTENPSFLQLILSSSKETIEKEGKALEHAIHRSRSDQKTSNRPNLPSDTGSFGDSDGSGGSGNE